MRCASRGGEHGSPGSPVSPRDRIAALIVASLAVAVSLDAARCEVVAGSGRAPNIAVIVADDMGYSDAGCYGGEIATPNLDRLAEGGLRFTQFYSTARCWPSRACILTGYYAQQVRMDPPKGRLPAWARVLPHYFEPLGYRCYHAGKWHLHGARRTVADGGFLRSYRVDDQDRFFSPQRTWLDDEKLAPVEQGSGYYATTAIADHAVAFLADHAREHKGRPFLLYLAFTAPHFPLHALEDDIDRYRGRYRAGWDAVRRQRWQRMRDLGLVACALSPPDAEIIPAWNFPAEKLRDEIGPGEVPRAVPWDSLSDQQQAFQATKMAIHAAMIDRMDREIGRVLDQIRAMGAFENTVIAFVSDNGASAEQIIRGDMHDRAAAPGSARSYLCLGPGWSTASNTPFRLHKSWVHEGGIASPLVVHWPAGMAARGELRHTPGHFIDLLPTMLDLVGAEPSPEWNGQAPPPLPGRSLAPVLAGDAPVERDFLYFHHGGNRALRVGDWKLVAAGRDGAWELYDLQSDRCETDDLAARRPDKVRELSALWQQAEDEFRRQAEP